MLALEISFANARECSISNICRSVSINQGLAGVLPSGFTMNLRSRYPSMPPNKCDQKRLDDQISVVTVTSRIPFAQSISVDFSRRYLQKALSAPDSDLAAAWPGAMQCVGKYLLRTSKPPPTIVGQSGFEVLVLLSARYGRSFRGPSPFRFIPLSNGW